MMRVRLRRRHLIWFVAPAAAVSLMVLAFGPVVRARVAAGAARHRLDVSVGGVRPGWFAVRLLDLQVRPHGVPTVQASVNEAYVGLGALLDVQRLELRGAKVVLDGPAALIREQWSAWREEHSEPSVRRGRFPSIEATGVSLRWIDGGSPDVGAELLGAAFRDDRGTRVTLTEANARFGRVRVDLSDASGDLDAKGRLVQAHASAATVGWIVGVDATRSDGATTEPTPAAPPPVAIAHAARTARRTRSPQLATADAGAPLLSLPDLHTARMGASAIASLLAEWMEPGAAVSVDLFTWKMTQDQPVPLTFGPGPVVFARAASLLELRYSSGSHAASTPLALRVLLPTDASDVVMTVDGGPIALSLLGVKEGAADLVDVTRATVAGRVRVVLAGDGSTLIFDADAAARDLSLSNPRLALDAVRGLDIALRARGAVGASGEMRVDDFAATLGALHLAGSGMLNQEPDHAVGAAHFEVLSATCQALLESIPVALLPTLQGTAITGTFGAHGSFAFDTRSLDRLELDYDVQDRCRLVQVPPALAHDRFMQPFTHRIYLPDGSTTEETTGPGAPNWTSLDHISPYMQTAVLTTEDGAFPKHHGYSQAAIRASIIANLKARRFVRGASTITMQLAKNLFLSRDKTLSRKLEEVVLTDYLEQTFTKDEILELYLNVIEFGPGVYGIASASEYYFGRTPAELNLAECLVLSSLLPAPLRYSAMRDGEQPPEGWMRTIHALMEVARRRGLLTDAELSEGENEQVLFWHGARGDPRPTPRTPTHARAPIAGQDSDIPDPFETVPDAP